MRKEDVTGTEQQDLTRVPHLGRYGGLPVTAVPGSSDRVRDLLRELGQREEKVKDAAQGLVDRIFEAVPRIDDTAARRQVLRAKRRVFAHRTTGLGAAAAERLTEVAPSVARECRAWDEEIAAVHDLEDELRSAAEEDDEAIRAALISTLEDEEYLSALAVAAPDFVRQHVAGHVDRSDTRTIRTLYLYATRAARKTSPFSGLTTVAEPGQPGQGRRFTTVATHVAWGLLETGAQDLESPFALRAAPVVPTEAAGHRELVLLSRSHFADDVVYREDAVLGATYAIPLVAGGAADRPGGATPRQVVADLSAADAGARFRRLVAAHLLRPVTPWSRDELALTALAERWPDELSGISRDHVARVASVADCFAGAGTAERLEHLEAVDGLARSVLTERERGGRTGLVYEDRESDVREPSPLSLEPVREDLAQLRDLVDPWVFRSHAYDVMVQRFVAAYGVGGRSSNPLAFVMSLALEGDGDLAVQRAMQADHTADEETRRARRGAGGASAAPRHLSAYLQLAASSRQELAAGGGVTVVNMFGSGNGALQARFHRLLGKQYADRVRRHVRALWGTQRVLEFQPWSDCNTGQATCSGLLPELRLPHEPEGEAGVALQDLTLHHDPVSNSLFLTHEGEPVGIAYLGLTPQHLTQSYQRWLTLLSDPWVRMPPASDHSQKMLRMRHPVTDELVHLPRVQEGRLVTRRAAWEVGPVLVASLFADERLDQLRRWHRLAETHGIPSEVFVHQEVGPGVSQHARKPIQVDLASAVSLDVLRRWVDPRARRLRLVEALPARDEHVVTGRGGGPVASEYVVNLSWPREGSRA